MVWTRPAIAVFGKVTGEGEPCQQQVLSVSIQRRMYFRSMEWIREREGHSSEAIAERTGD